MRDGRGELAGRDRFHRVDDAVEADHLDVLAGSVCTARWTPSAMMSLAAKKPARSGCACQDVGGRGQGLLAVPVGADHDHGFELAFDRLLEALDAGIAADIADDAGDQRDLGAVGTSFSISSPASAPAATLSVPI